MCYDNAEHVGFEARSKGPKHNSGTVNEVAM